jgi:hypothetical protein
VAAGVYNDTLFKQRAYLTITILNVLGISWQTYFLLPFDAMDDAEDKSSYYLMLGFTTTVVEFFIRILIPLYFATKNRVTYELTMAGTLIATVNLIFFWSGRTATELYGIIRQRFP